ncbi:hypothetical protein [Streptomyces sp. NPDC090083]|uniref:hypothetical protein n=1 Tax=Streptomyces sp. NPDC090083 TaxID=3365941 RepID=UPI0038303A61
MRSTLVAGLGALALFVTLPASPASAASGEFRYIYVGPGGIDLDKGLTDPQSGVCIDIPETVGNNVPALAPSNETDSTVTVFKDADCAGDVYFTMDPGKRLSRRLEFRSAIFA